MWTPTSSVHGVVDATTNSHGLQKSRYCTAALWEGEHPDPCLDRLLLLFSSMHQRRFSFILLRFALGNYLLQITKAKDVADYFLQITKKIMLQIQGKKWLNWLHSILGRISTDLKKLLERYAVNICCFNSGWGSFSKSKPQSSLGTMQAWFPTGKLICGSGSCVPPCACQFSRSDLGYMRHCHVDHSL